MVHIKRLCKSYLVYPLQAALVIMLYGIFRALPVSLASAVGGAIGRALGPRLSVTQGAVANLSAVFPEKTKLEIDTIVRGMWDNLGRTAAEYPHVAQIDTTDPSGPVVVEGGDVYARLRALDGPCIIFSGHFANWELLPASAAQRGLHTVLVYRAANNPMVDWLFRRRTGHVDASIAPKGVRGARILFRAMKAGKTLGILVDQKMNDGIAVPFFGRDAMTAPALAELALRFQCPVVPAHVVRREGATFKIVVEEPLTIVQTGDKKADVAALMGQVNSRMEQWARDNPEQWLWVHSRWPKGTFDK
ncbi:MAG: lauroyl acyltransferase [Rhodospirillales bacterium]|nr:lauroyl acyltransferase [Rhodospirillales bacterium]